ncbi:hypothetical protein BDN67DRAFT_967167 [Paxillus ammoniavirescens]|nr:hypothetical protein BDN67DRAFT_967167 [Paxillus ammoniavirescens]
MRRAKAFTPLQDLYENIFNANISDLLLLQPGHFITVLRQQNQKAVPEILLGKVIALYTNSGACGAKHEAISSVNSAGMPSYTMVRIYRPSHGSSYTSLACPSLGAAAFIRVPSTHILFSFAASSGSILRIDITTDAAHPFELITLCPLSSAVMQGLHARVNSRASRSNRTG